MIKLKKGNIVDIAYKNLEKLPKATHIIRLNNNGNPNMYEFMGFLLSRNIILAANQELPIYFCPSSHKFAYIMNGKKLKGRIYETDELLEKILDIKNDCTIDFLENTNEAIRNFYSAALRGNIIPKSSLEIELAQECMAISYYIYDVLAHGGFDYLENKPYVANPNYRYQDTFKIDIMLILYKKYSNDEFKQIIAPILEWISDYSIPCIQNDINTTLEEEKNSSKVYSKINIINKL